MFSFVHKFSFFPQRRVTFFESWISWNILQIISESSQSFWICFLECGFPKFFCEKDLNPVPGHPQHCPLSSTLTIICPISPWKYPAPWVQDQIELSQRSMDFQTIASIVLTWYQVFLHSLLHLILTIIIWTVTILGMKNLSLGRVIYFLLFKFTK